jgi:hypothetical protein
MSANTTATTNVVGYFNPNSWPIYIEISELNIKCELKPGQYIRDRAGNYINDPVFDDYVQPKGLSKATGDAPVPVNFVPRFVKTVRPAHSVTQATSFVRQPDGTVVPSYAQNPNVAAPEIPANKCPHIGMTVEKARQLGLIGKPRIVPEDYGVTDSTGAPTASKDLPGIKYSIESPPKIHTAAPLTPELTEADERLSPQEAARRAQLQQSLTRASTATSGENFDPARVRPAGAAVAPVPMKAPSEPTSITAIPPKPVAKKAPAPAPAPQPAPAPHRGGIEIPQRVLPKRVAAVVQEPPPEPEVETAEEDQSGTIQPIQEGQEGLPEPTLEPPPSPAQEQQPEDAGKRFICLADGKSFKYRSELKRYVERKFPQNAEELLKPYPAEG